MNTALFFETCGDLLAGDNYDEFTRVSASTLLGRTVVTEDNNAHKYFWDFINPNLKSKIKHQMLGTLVHPNMSIVKAGANVICLTFCF